MYLFNKKKGLISQIAIGLLSYCALASSASADSAALFDAVAKPDQAVGQGEVANQEVVVLNAAIFDLAEGDEVSFSYNDTTYTIVVENIKTKGPNRQTLVGTVSGEEGGRVIITRADNAYFGSIRVAGHLFKISSDDGVVLFFDQKSQGLQTMPFEHDAFIPDTGGAQSDEQPTTAEAPVTAAAAASTVIDLYVVYSDGFAAAHPGSQATARIDFLVDTSNQAFSDSGIDLMLNVLGTKQYTYGDASSNGTALSAVTNNTGVFSTVDSERDALGADITVFMRDFDSSNQGGCGVAWVYAGGSFSNFAYAVVSDGTDNNFFCSDLTFAHELGHNLGSNHDRGTAGNNNVAGQNQRFSYSFGHGNSGVFGTIMSYISPEVAKFSNVNLDCNGSPCGVAIGDPSEADNVTSITNTKDDLAGLRTRAYTARYNQDDDSNADILWRNNATGVNWMYFMSGATVLSSSGVNTVATEWEAARGDFNGDGKSDIIWRNSSTGVNYIYLMNGSSIQSISLLNTVPLNWNLAGVADLSGDGNDDLVWYNTSTGQIWLYTMNGASISSSAGIATVSDLNWQIDAVNDFTGDGMADLLFRNQSTGVNWLYQMNGNTISASMGINTVSLDWTIVATGDFNGDGTYDIVWRNSVSGAVYFYLMSGGAISSVNYVSTVADSNWEIELPADYDGDGDFDVLWRNSTSGDNYLYIIQNGSLSSGASIQNAGTDWEVIDNEITL
jgi:hypothetical protein